MWYLVGNPEDRFSHNEAHMLVVIFVKETGGQFYFTLPLSQSFQPEQ